MFLGLLDGTFTGWDEEQIIAYLTRSDDRDSEERNPPGENTPHPEPGASGNTAFPCSEDSGETLETADGEGLRRSDRDEPSRADPSPNQAPADEHGCDESRRDRHGPGDPGPDNPDRDELGRDTAEADKPDPDGPSRNKPNHNQPGRDETSPDEPGSGGPDHAMPHRDDPLSGERAGAGAARPRHHPPEASAARRRGPRAGVELRVRLSTLLGLDRCPAEIAGWGHTHAENARLVTAGQTGAQWRYAICDEQGELLHCGLITGRPRGYPARSRLRGVVEIQVPLTLLKTLYDHPDRHPEWAAVIAQITADITAFPARDEDRHQHREGPEAAEKQATGPPAADRAQDTRAGDGQGRDRRFPDARMRRRLEVRDRRCGFPGCRMPARDSDLDHIRQWLSGGPTQEHNLTSLCRHDHRLKDEHGWTLAMTVGGALRWTSRLGLTYTVRRTPIIIDLPKPSYCPPAPAITTFDDDTEAEAEADIWADPEHPPEGTSTGKTLTGTTKDRPPPLVDDEKPPF